MDNEHFKKQRSENMKRIRKQMKGLTLIKSTSEYLKLREEKMELSKLNKAHSELVSGLCKDLEVDEELGKNMNKFLEKYEMGDKIGEGTDGVVRACYNKQTKKKYAVKSMRMEEEQILFLKRNFNCIKQLSHPNVIKYRGLYLDMKKHTANLVMEYQTMKPLSKYPNLPEKQLKNIMRQVFETLQYIHSQYLCHRDIKPSNILYDDESGKIKLIDFGISRRVIVRNTKTDLLSMTGTLFYRAPEMLLGMGYDQRVDIWAAGITLYKMIAGYTPFEAEEVFTTIDNIRNGRLEFQGEAWCKEGKFVKDLIRRLLTNRDQRLTVKEALKHFWFVDPEVSPTPNWTMKSEYHQRFSLNKHTKDEQKIYNHEDSELHSKKKKDSEPELQRSLTDQTNWISQNSKDQMIIAAESQEQQDTPTVKTNKK